MVPHYYRNVSAVVFVFDITRRSTFESIPKWFEECERYATDRTIPRILVGNKCDDEENREVANYEAQRLADTHGMPLFEVRLFLYLWGKMYHLNKFVEFSVTHGSNPAISSAMVLNMVVSKSWWECVWYDNIKIVGVLAIRMPQQIGKWTF